MASFMVMVMTAVVMIKVVVVVVAVVVAGGAKDEAVVEIGGSGRKREGIEGKFGRKGRLMVNDSFSYK